VSHFIHSPIGAAGGTFTYNGFTGRILNYREDPEHQVKTLDRAPLHSSVLVTENIKGRKLDITTLVEDPNPPAQFRNSRLGAFSGLMASYDTFLLAMFGKGIYPLTRTRQDTRYLNCKAVGYDRMEDRDAVYWQPHRISFEAYDPFWYALTESSVDFTALTSKTLAIGGTMRTALRFEVAYRLPTMGFTLTQDGTAKPFSYLYSPPVGVTVIVVVDMLNRTVSNDSGTLNPMQYVQAGSIFWDVPAGASSFAINWSGGSSGLVYATALWRDRWL
jgi:hypothetical protein